MAKREIDRDKLRVHLRRLRKADLLGLLDRALDLLPSTRLPALLEGHVDPEDLRPDVSTGGAGLLGSVQCYRDASLAGEYYDSFDVNSRNFREVSEGTETWMEECRRLLRRCAEAARTFAGEEIRDAFDILFGLLRHIDEGEDDVVFFADEGGSWQVGVEWRAVLPAYFACLAATAEPEEYAARVDGVIREFADCDRARQMKAARAAASPAQRKALRGG